MRSSGLEIGAQAAQDCRMENRGWHFSISEPDDVYKLTSPGSDQCHDSKRTK